METISYHWANRQPKLDWGQGPWQTEPDKIQWADPASGLPCLAVRNHMGAWCGYVGVPNNHPYHSTSYTDLTGLTVHGGLSYSDRCAPHANGGEGTAICHVVNPGEDDNTWWLGFDCAHYNDHVPALAHTLRGLKIESYEHHTSYKTLDYVRAEAASLAHQLSELT